MAKKTYVRNSENTEWVELASATTDLSSYLTISSASTTYQPIILGVSNTEIGYLDGVTSEIQSQINSKLSTSSASTTYATIANPTFTGTVFGITRSMVGLGNVDNTSDANKPVSSATQTALNLKANLSGASFSGSISAPSGSSFGALTITSGLIQSSGDINISAATVNDTTDISSSVRMSTVYNKTSSSGANMLIATSPLGFLYRSTASSGRWKNSIEELTGELDASKLLELPVHKFKFNNDYLDENDQRYDTFVPGFIAEEVAEIYPIAAEKDADGLPSDWNSRLIIPPMLKLIQDQAQKITELELRIFNLENS